MGRGVDAGRRARLTSFYTRNHSVKTVVESISWRAAASGRGRKSIGRMNFKIWFYTAMRQRNVTTTDTTALSIPISGVFWPKS